MKTLQYRELQRRLVRGKQLDAIERQESLVARLRELTNQEQLRLLAMRAMEGRAA